MSIIKSTNLVILLISLLGCGQSSVDLDSSSLLDSDVDKNKLVMIPGHEQLVTLHYDEAFVEMFRSTMQQLEAMLPIGKILLPFLCNH